jgi:predicted  nucleic acid-binding Zn-ribbon protein
MEIVKAVLAPKSYNEKFTADFHNLPQDWQAFLNQHEAETENKLNDIVSQLQAYQKLEDIFGVFKFRLQQRGIKCIQDWLEGLAWIDAAMDEAPAETLDALAAIYGVKHNIMLENHNDAKVETAARLSKLENTYHNLLSFLQEQQIQRLADAVQIFGKQTDKDGNALHPYFENVKGRIFELLQSGAVRSIEEAYENALWTTPYVRNELIKQQISSQAAEAEKAKKAAFAPKGKSETPERPLTVREELEKNMAALFG